MGWRLLAAVPRWLTAVSLFAAALALIVPSGWLDRRSDLLLALLVFLTALGIPWSELLGLRSHWVAVSVLSLAPLVVLAGVAWAVSRGFSGGVRDGLLATGLSSSEVASVGLVAVSGADATVALGVVTGSLVAAAVLGPVGVSVLGGGHADGASLLGRFALVVLLPLAVGVALRSWGVAAPSLSGRDEERDGAAALVVAVLVYAALSGAQDGQHFGLAALAGAIFLAVSAILGTAWRVLVPGATAIPGAFAITMRDFAVAAALATQAFGASAGVVPGIYGVLMLVGGSAVASNLRTS